MADRRAKIDFASMNKLLGAPEEEEKISLIPLLQVDTFPNHPYKVSDDDSMLELVQSIKKNGVLTPITVRPKGDGRYQTISGHRRLHASNLAGIAEIPAIIKQMDDNEATIAMVDSNLQRDEILPSERAFAFKMKMDAMRRQGERSDLETSGSDFQKLETADLVGLNWKMSGRTVRTYIRLTLIIPPILYMVDTQKIRLNTAVEISYLSQEIQEWLAEYMYKNGTISYGQATALRAKVKLDSMSQDQIVQMLNETRSQRKDRGKVTFSASRLDRYFPKNYSAAQRQEIIINLLEKWKEENDGID